MSLHNLCIICKWISCATRFIIRLHHHYSLETSLTGNFLIQCFYNKSNYTKVIKTYLRVQIKNEFWRKQNSKLAKSLNNYITNFEAMILLRIKIWILQWHDFSEGIICFSRNLFKRYQKKISIWSQMDW